MSSLLIINNIRILLDCGWNEDFHTADISALTSLVSSSEEGGTGGSEQHGIDAVLISQPDLAHCGALPYLYSTLKCKAPIYMTIPVMLLGPLAIYDAYIAHSNTTTEDSKSDNKNTNTPTNPITSFTLDNVKEAFETTLYGGNVHTLRFLEEVSFSTENITLSPSNSGYMLGGSVWRISKGTETILYAPVFNHKNEKHLAKASIQTLFRSPSAIITSSYIGQELIDPGTSTTPTTTAAPSSSSSFHPSGGHGDSQGKEFVDTCLRSLRVGGHVLIPCDTVGRVLELLIRLDSLWGLHYHYPIYYLNYVAPNVIDRVNTVLEYMIDKITREFTDARIAPFDFRPERSRIRVTTNIQEVLTTANVTPIIVLTSFTNMTIGPARQLLTQWIGDARNTILLTSKDSLTTNSVASQLFRHDGIPPSSVILESFTTVPLTGLELKRYKENQAEETLRAARAVALERLRSEEAAEMAEAITVPIGMNRNDTLITGVSSPSVHSLLSSVNTGAQRSTVSDAMVTDETVTGKNANNTMDETMTPVSPSLVPTGTENLIVSPNHLDQQQRMRNDNDGTGMITMENEYTDDEDIINHLEYVDDALSYSVKSGNPSLSSLSSFGSIHRQKGLIGRFPMFARDEHFSYAATVRLQHSQAIHGKDNSNNAPKLSKDELMKLTSFRSTYTDYGQTINPLEYEETESDKIASGSGVAYGTMATVHTGLPSTIAAQMMKNSTNATATNPANPEDNVPTKKVRLTTTLRVSCKLRYISGLEGRTDAKSLLNVLESLSPLKIVYIHGTSSQGTALSTNSNRFCSSVYSPQIGQSVDLSSNTSAISVKVNGCYFASLGLTTLGTHNIGFINANIKRIHELGTSSVNNSTELIKLNSYGIAENITLGHPDETNGDEDEKMNIVTATGTGHNPVYLRPGPLRAAEIRKQLAAVGIESTIIDGIVVTQNGILIKRIDQELSSTTTMTSSVVPSGFGLEIEGPAIPEYFQVRKILYNFYTML